MNLFQNDDNKSTPSNNIKKFNSVNVNIQQVKNKKIGRYQMKENNSNTKLINKNIIINN